MAEPIRDRVETLAGDVSAMLTDRLGREVTHHTDVLSGHVVFAMGRHAYCMKCDALTAFADGLPSAGSTHEFEWMMLGLLPKDTNERERRLRELRRERLTPLVHRIAPQLERGP